MPRLPFVLLMLVIIAGSCKAQDTHDVQAAQVYRDTIAESRKYIEQYDTVSNTIHVLVALCDNTYQGIVPVPVKIGNGQDPNNNLYWGCAFGIRSFFKKSKEWKFLKAYKVDSERLERLIFRHVTRNYYLVADAYDGKSIKQCTEDFFSSCAGLLKDTLHIEGANIGINGNAGLVAYVGHDGLMDFKLEQRFACKDNRQRDAIMLACISKSYFGAHLKTTHAYPLLWSTGLMAPEAYVLHDALTGYVNKENNEQIRSRAAAAYARYQKCSIKAAKALLVSGY